MHQNPRPIESLSSDRYIRLGSTGVEWGLKCLGGTERYVEKTGLTSFAVLTQHLPKFGYRILAFRYASETLANWKLIIRSMYSPRLRRSGVGFGMYSRNERYVENAFHVV
jgi:hypothetical protein